MQDMTKKDIATKPHTKQARICGQWVPNKGAISHLIRRLLAQILPKVNHFACCGNNIYTAEQNSYECLFKRLFNYLHQHCTASLLAHEFLPPIDFPPNLIAVRWETLKQYQRGD